jgi:hypothetical protein
MFNNLPGLVLWAEDYFSTISVNKISYETNDSNYNKAVENVTNKLKKIEDDDFSNENVFLLRKSKLVSQLKLMR